MEPTADSDERDQIEFETPTRLDLAFPWRSAAPDDMRKCSHADCGKASKALPADQITVIKHEHPTQPKGGLLHGSVTVGHAA